MADMKIEKDQTSFNLGHPAKSIEPMIHRLAAREKNPPVADGSFGWTGADNNRPAFRHIHVIHARLNTVAASIRVADGSMKQIGDYIDRMKEQLTSIVKSYPPFPPGSEERIRYLKNFSLFRKQIDQLTIPPADEGARMIMAGPVAAEKGTWDSIVGSDAEPIHHQEVHTGPTGLNIPNLPADASDAGIEAAAANLITARNTLSQRRSGLAADAAVISHSMRYNSETANPYQGVSGSADATEVAAESRSMELRLSLTIQSVRGLTENQTMFLQLLG